MRNYFALALLALVTALTGCAGSQSGSVYSQGQARREMNVRLGVVESVREVTLEGTQTGAGTVAGGAVGGIAGSNVGKGKGSTVGAILGAVAGGVAGHALEESMTRKKGLEITVKLDNGQLTAIVQEADETFRPGDHVRLLSSGGSTRVSH